MALCLAFATVFTKKELETKMLYRDGSMSQITAGGSRPSFLPPHISPLKAAHSSTSTTSNYGGRNNSFETPVLLE
jgi:hypothetical protein